MTAPAEDPRGGEHVGSCRIFYAERRCTCVGPAAGRGDTDSSGEDAGFAYLERLAATSNNPILLRAVEEVRAEMLGGTA